MSVSVWRLLISRRSVKDIVWVACWHTCSNDWAWMQLKFDIVCGDAVPRKQGANVFFVSCLQFDRCWEMLLWCCDTKEFQETTLSTGEEQLPNAGAEAFQWSCAWAERGTCTYSIVFAWFPCSKSKESAVLAKWLKGVTLAVAEANPMDEHAAWFGLDFIVLFDHCPGLGFQCMYMWHRTKNLGYERLYLSTLWQWDHVCLRIWILEHCWVTETFRFCRGRIFCSTLLTIVPRMMVW